MYMHEQTVSFGHTDQFHSRLLLKLNLLVYPMWHSVLDAKESKTCNSMHPADYKYIVHRVACSNLFFST